MTAAKMMALGMPLWGSLLLVGCSETPTEPNAAPPSIVSDDKAALIRELQGPDRAVASSPAPPTESEPLSDEEFWRQALKSLHDNETAEEESDEVREWMAVHGATLDFIETMEDPSLSALGDSTDPQEIYWRDHYRAQTKQRLLDGAPAEIRRRYGLE